MICFLKVPLFSSYTGWRDELCSHCNLELQKNLFLYEFRKVSNNFTTILTFIPGFQAIHICDAMFNIVSIQFWGGIGKHSLDSMIKLGSVLLFSNLQWRKSSANGNFFQTKQGFQPTIPCLYVTEFTLGKIFMSYLIFEKYYPQLLEHLFRLIEFYILTRDNFM